MKISGSRGQEEGKNDRPSKGRIFRAVKLFCIILQQLIHVIKHLFKLVEDTGVNVCIKLWILGDNNVSLSVATNQLQQISSSVVTNISLWCKILILRRTVHMWGQSAYKNLQYFLLYFAVNLKVSFKKSFVLIAI